MIVITQNGHIVNPACQPYDDSPEAQALRKRLAEPPPQSETGPVGGPVSGTEGTEKATIDAPIVSDSQRQRKAFCTMQAQFARAGFELKSKQHPAGITLFEVSRHGQTRVFSGWHDVVAFLAQVQQGGHHG